jgi:hypothetical protein
VKQNHLRLTVILLSVVVSAALAAQRPVPTPKSILGFEPGQERRIADWNQITKYFTALAQTSSRIQVRTLGRSTLGRPLIVATISAEANLKKLDRYREIQRLLADPRFIVDDAEAARLAAEGKAVVALSCSLHSTEIVASQMSMELAHRLVTDNSAETRQILDNTIVLLFPSINPDGIDIVASWYEKTLGTPFEGTAPPELYHHYAGHDNNRDWFMLTQMETQLVTRLFYGEWFPQIVYDIHQMGPNGARMFVPPFYDPSNPNIDPLILREVARIGSHMAADLTAAGFKGIVTSAQYDTWWHGGLRTAPYYHNAIGILSEAASARLMSPREVSRDQLTGATRGLASLLEPATNFPDPWPGGIWQPKDIMDMELVAVRSLLLLAARYKDEFMLNFYRLGKKAVDLGRTASPFAYLISSEQHDPATAARLINILIQQGVEVHQARTAFPVDGVRYPAGTYVILMAQPYRACAKALLEPQAYPERHIAGGDDLEQPYDVTGWTLPMQMGVRASEIRRPFEADLRKIEAAVPPGIGVEPPPDGMSKDVWIIRPETNNAFALVNELTATERSARVRRLKEDVEIEEKLYERGSFVITQADAQSHRLAESIAQLASKHLVRVYPVRRAPTTAVSEVKPARLGLYRSWVPASDEGWTRWVLEQFGFNFEVIRDADIRAGDLDDRFDVIILPGQWLKEIAQGHEPGQYPQQYTGGIGLMGAQNLRAFVQAGGTLVCLGGACEVVLEHFELPVRNVLAQVSKSEFFCPGSVLGLTVDNVHPVGHGMPAAAFAFFRNGVAFEVSGQPANVQIVARYAASNVLKSGFLMGEEKIAGRPAVLEAQLGRGRVILIGFPPQHRGQTHGTFKLLFNSIYAAQIEIRR